MPQDEVDSGQLKWVKWLMQRGPQMVPPTPLISHATEGTLEMVSMAQEDGITQGVFSIVVRANYQAEL